MVMKGVHLRTLQILIGHENIETTEIYAHVAKDYLAKNTAKIDL